MSVDGAGGAAAGGGVPVVLRGPRAHAAVVLVEPGHVRVNWVSGHLEYHPQDMQVGAHGHTLVYTWYCQYSGAYETVHVLAVFLIR